MKFRLLTAFALLALGATGAAADPWNGGYVGGNAGVAFLDGDASVSIPATTNFNLSDTGFTFGGQAGYNWQHGDFVFGIEGDINYLDLDDSGATPGATGGLFELDTDWFATLRGRAGMLMGDTLFYGTGGIAFLDSDLTAQVIAAAAAGAAASDSDVLPVLSTVQNRLTAWRLFGKPAAGPQDRLATEDSPGLHTDEFVDILGNRL